LQGQKKNKTIRIAGGESINKIMRKMKEMTRVCQ